MDLKVRLKNFCIELEHPIMNAAGTIKKVDEVQEAARSAVSAIMVGSITVKQRDGNSGNVYRNEGSFSLNSLGIPNGGVPYYSKHLPEMVEIAHDVGKPLFLSVAGFDEEEFVRLAVLGYESGVDVVELNFGCPNIVEGNIQKAVISFDFDLIEAILLRVREVLGEEKKVLVKCSPFSNPQDRKRFAGLVGQSPLTSGIVGGITAVNTFPNAFGFDEDDQPLITPNNGFGGMGGGVMKPIGLAHVVEFSRTLPQVDIIGAGGVSAGFDVHDYILGGAKAVQIATALLGEVGELDLGVVGDILYDYVAIREEVDKQVAG